LTKNKFSGPFLPFPRWVLKYLGNDSVGKVVLLTILLYMDSDTQEVTTSYGHVAKLTGYSRRTVIRAVNRLVSSNVLIRKVRVGAKGQLSNLYVVNFNNPSTLVSRVTLPSVTGDTPRSVTTDTTPSVTGDTQSRITINKNNHNKNLLYKRGETMNDVTSGYEIDGELLK
jgi:hypothetical protein